MRRPTRVACVGARGWLVAVSSVAIPSRWASVGDCAAANMSDAGRVDVCCKLGVAAACARAAFRAFTAARLRSSSLPSAAIVDGALIGGGERLDAGTAAAATDMDVDEKDWSIVS
jgi:hypothetical protein